MSVGRSAAARRGEEAQDPSLHPSWQAFLRFCQELGFGEIEKLKIQDGLPVLAELATRKVKFGP